jgi:hypothetical protein
VRILFREKLLVDPHADGFGVGVEMFTGQRGIADGGSHEDIGAASAPDQKTYDLRVGFDQILRRRRLVVYIAGIDIRPLRQQVFRDLHRAGEVQRRLPIPATGVNQFGLGRDQFPELFRHGQTSRGVNIHRRAPLDQVRGQFGIRQIQDAKATRPPSAAPVDIGARADQHINQRPAAPARGLHDGRRIEVKQRFVHLRFQLGVALQELAQLRRISVEHRLLEIGNKIDRQRRHPDLRPA